MEVKPPKKYEIDWRSCYSGTPPSELDRLAEYCERVVTRFQHTDKARKDIALEIGSHEGASAALLSQYFDTVICIDPWGKEELLDPTDRIASFVGEPGSNPHFKAFMQNMERLGIYDRVVPIVNTSRALDIFAPIGLELAFVDDGHIYSACCADIARCLRHLQHEGLLVCHDYKRPGFGYPPYDPNHPHHSSVDPYIGVQEAVDEAIETFKLQIVDHFEGIVALQRRMD